VNLEKVRVRVKKIIMKCRTVSSDPGVSSFYCLPAPHLTGRMVIITHATKNNAFYSVIYHGDF
jgi:hypothetical protein